MLILLVILCALTYAIYLIGSGYLIPKLGTWYYTALALSAASIAILIHHLALYQCLLRLLLAAEL